MSGDFTIRLKIEALPEGLYLATSDDLPGLVAQGRTIADTMETARDVARKLIESYLDHGDTLPAGLKRVSERFEVDVAVGI